MSNDNMRRARREKNDEYYTRYDDIEAEMKHYKKYLKNKTIYCNADDPKHSKFVKYFEDNFKKLKLKKLIATHYVSQYDILFNDKTNPTYYEYDGDQVKLRQMDGNGSFDSIECVELLNECDIVITNPPFSLFIPFINQLYYFEKDFIIVGNLAASTLASVYEKVINNECEYGFTSPLHFNTPNNKETSIATKWYQNILNIEKEPIELTKSIKDIEYFKYWNYDAINIDKIEDIPYDYYDPMGVPMTFLDKWDKRQFELVDAREFTIDRLKAEYWRRNARTIRDGNNGEPGCKHRWQRVVIRRKK